MTKDRATIVESNDTIVRNYIFVSQVYLVAQIIFPSINTWKYINIMFFAFHWLAMSSSCYNPFIYGIYSEKFKREFRMRLTCSVFGAPTSPNESIEMHEIRQIMFRLVLVIKMKIIFGKNKMRLMLLYCILVPELRGTLLIAQPTSGTKIHPVTVTTTYFMTEIIH